MIRAIGGKTELIGWVASQISFNYLDVIIDVAFHVIREHIFTILSIKDMVENELDMSI